MKVKNSFMRIFADDRGNEVNIHCFTVERANDLSKKVKETHPNMRLVYLSNEHIEEDENWKSKHFEL